ncbi:MAG: DUF2807 domain-containing protein [Chitinophagaceae bacterium]|nr:DUF2807 domain-containing protein [Chitinophagaceae bacterium]
MKRIVYLLILLTGALPALAQNEKNIVYDANAELRKVSGYTAVEVSGAIDLYLSQGTEEAVAVSASEQEIISRIRTELKGNILHIYFDAKGLNWKRWGNHKMKAYVTFKNLRGIEASGACNVRATEAIRGDELKIQMSGASDFRGELQVKNLQLEASGASQMRVSGMAEQLRVDANGASDIKGYDLKADKARIDASGASVVRITINKEFNASASGGSSIYYRGEGLIRDINTSGGATVKRRSDE